VAWAAWAGLGCLITPQWETQVKGTRILLFLLLLLLLLILSEREEE